MNKFDCLVYEMYCIQSLKPALNVQSDSLRAKVFVKLSCRSFMQTRFNLASSQTALYRYLCNLFNGARCTETSVFINCISCFMCF